MQHAKTPNKLINQTSPYLLQHAFNPVQWQPWGKEVFKQAAEEDKLIIISIGYSACHWCHVMEHESFEDTGVANIMNEHFVSVKVDREERPDVDQVYMTAVQLMRQQGGWPLNVIALPDGRPVWGGTYFPKGAWKNALMQLVEVYKSDPEKMEEYATKLVAGIKQSDTIIASETPKQFEDKKLHVLVDNWKQSFDHTYGGANRAPKFPLPNNYQFLLRYAKQFNKTEILNHVNLTLTQMAWGGIYDQIGGGFARYSTDENWKVPHFEKMLYDNGQLISLYAEAYGATKNELYKTIVEQTIQFLITELQSNEGLFFSALDADSEGEEGRYYCWNKEELKTILGDDFNWVADYYNINPKGYWENGKYILLRKQSKEAFANEHGYTVVQLTEKIQTVNNLLLKARNKRIRPGLDDKILTSWNALAITGLIDAYKYIQQDEYLIIAKKALKTLIEKAKGDEGRLNRNYKDGISNINAYLDDYALLAESCIAMYEVTFDEKWVEISKELVDYCMTHFSNHENSLFYYTSILDDALITRPIEINDNVIPSSNATMAKNLVQLGYLTNDTSYLTRAKKMLGTVYSKMEEYGSGYSNWCMAQMYLSEHMYQIAITGTNAHNMALTLYRQYYVPNKLIFGTNTNDSNLPMLNDKWIENQTTIYVCKNYTCKKPVNSVFDAIQEIVNY